MAKQAKVKPASFHHQLILNQYMLKLFEAESFEKLADGMQSVEWEGLDEHNVSRFYYFLANRTVERKQLTKDMLMLYDENIIKHTLKISEKRNEPIVWKYFQYLSLLFTEIYLDRYFTDKQMLLTELNEQVAAFNEDKAKKEQIDPYEEEDLRKLAFWNATGSGKTLLMHVNILQYQEYLKLHHREDELNKIILLTPNEGLSTQHLNEFRSSGIIARLFNKDSGRLFGSDVVEIIDIHKLKEEGKEKTISVEAFEGNNLVLVDEGHRGSSGMEWRSMRDQLGEQGFSFEYSATFGQAVQSAKKTELIQEYAKCILFDYSYKYFYKDGFGKDYQIMNMNDDTDREKRDMYLTAGVLTFYQQQLLYDQEKFEMKRFHLEKPLWMFVGHTVTKSASKSNQQTVSDVVDVLLFLKDFIQNKADSADKLGRLVGGKSGLTDRNGQDLFTDHFRYLVKEKLWDGEVLYHDILKRLFNCDVSGASLYIDDLKGIEGELGLRVGDHDYFGVINVGDEKSLQKLCEKNGLNTNERDFARSLFQSINSADSTVNFLLGSKKFTEGWSSWRVSMMGLMNVGKNEGSEIIQLFGRGVRLKGYNFSLKRSNHVDQLSPGDRPKYIELLETLNVFGVRADYMKKFKEYLEEEGLPTEKQRLSLFVPVNKMKPKKELKTIVVPKDKNFKKEGPKPVLSEPPQYLKDHPIILNWYPKIQALESKKRGKTFDSRENHSFTKDHIALMNMDEIYFALEEFKNQSKMYNMNLSKDMIKTLLEQDCWYNLFIPEEDLSFNHFQFDRDVNRWQLIAIALLKKYMDRYFNFKKDEWQSKFMTYQSTDQAFIENGLIVEEGRAGYQVSVDVEESMSSWEKFNQLREAILSGEIGEWSTYNHHGYQVFGFDHHFYNPLVFVEKGNTSVKVAPVPLNEGEKDFVLDLKGYLKDNHDFFKDKELYLLRNQSTGEGLGFFEAGNFHPDFLLWILIDGHQYLSFVDPKGIRNLDGGIENPKIQFSQKIKELEGRLADYDSSLVLSSFIISNTRLEEMTHWRTNEEELKHFNVLFQEDHDTYIGEMMEKILS